MSPLFAYLLKASVTVFILWAFYVLCLRRLTFHRLNRYFFLAGILFSMAWPALPLTEWLSKAQEVKQVVIYLPISMLAARLKPDTPAFTPELAIKLIYFGGILFMLARLTVQLLSLRRIFKRSEITWINGVKVRTVKEKINPFSFFGFIFLNPECHSATELSAIIQHEKVHELLTHSVDILLSELFKVLLWFNPFTWLFCRAVKENIEFEVDRTLMLRGIDCKAYQYSLLKLSDIKNQIVLTNHFNLSNLKTRIIMMNKNQSSKIGLAAYALVLPLVLLCMVFSYAVAQEKSPLADTVKHVMVVKHDTEKIPDGALIILDGKVVDKTTLDAMNPDDIYSMNVIQGKQATDVWGRKGKNGVVLITSRKEERVKHTTIVYHLKDSTAQGKEGKPIIIIDGKQISDGELKDLDPKDIAAIDVLKDEYAVKEFGDQGKHGVVKIIRKNSSYSTSSSSSGGGKTITVVTTNHAEGDGTGEGKGKSSSEFTYTITDDGKATTEKKYVITGKPDGEEKHVVIRVDTKDGGATDNFEVKPDGKMDFDGAYLLLNGKEVDAATIKAMDPKDISTMEVYKGAKATLKYGDKAKNGVVLITTKKK